MKRQATRPQPAPFRSARRQFDLWRSQRPRGARIPPRLWKAAVALARQHGVSKTSQALGLDYYSLQERVVGEPRQPAARAQSAGAFVEIPLPALPVPASAPCVLELEDGQGATLRLQFSGLVAEELGALVRHVWSEGG